MLGRFPTPPVPPMRKLPILLSLLLVSLLAACSSGPPKRIFPPQASLQELRVQDDGQWVAHIRIQNFSTVPMRFSRLQATLSVAGQEAARIDIDPAMSVGPGSIEVVQHVFAPAAGPRTAVSDAFANRRAVRYQLTGRIASSEHGTDEAFDYSSALNPVPGLTGVLR
jgi:hypothetical protein